MPTEIDEHLGYDADHEDPRQYCPHGTWIGSWWGPDYLCHACEMGISVPADAYSRLQRAEQRYTERIWHENFINQLPTITADMNPTDRNTFVSTAVNLVMSDQRLEEILMNLSRIRAEWFRFWMQYPDFDPDDESQRGY